MWNTGQRMIRPEPKATGNRNCRPIAKFVTDYCCGSAGGFPRSVLQADDMPRGRSPVPAHGHAIREGGCDSFPSIVKARGPDAARGTTMAVVSPNAFR